MLYSFLTALLRDELRHCEMKNPRNHYIAIFNDVI
ncbi:hypothetical protein LTSEWAN_2269, partial [Salmonella enterica subsp. enterica serovar Wandsworth str. A4-580]